MTVSGLNSIVLYKIFPIISLVIFSVREIFTSSIFIIISTLLVFPYLIYVLKNNLWNIRRLLPFLFFTSISGLFNIFFTNNGIGGSILFLGTFTLGIFLVENKQYAKYIGLGLLVFELIYLCKTIFIDQLDPANIYEEMGLSRNYPGGLLVLYCSLYGFFYYLEKGKLPFILPSISLIIAYILNGRSSLAALIAISIVGILYASSKPRIRVIVFCALCAILIDKISDIQLLFKISSFGANGITSARSEIWQSYIDNMGPAEFIFGPETMNMPIVSIYGGNPHNAFMNFHRRMGLIGIFLLLILIIQAYLILFRRRKYVLMFFLTMLLFRMSFDSMLVSGQDFIFYAILFYPLISHDKILSSSFLSNVPSRTPSV